MTIAQWLKSKLSRTAAKPPTLIFTTKGYLDEALLEKRDGVVDNDNEHTTWVEYWLDGECVHRSVHVHLKQGLELAPALEGF